MRNRMTVLAALAAAMSTHTGASVEFSKGPEEGVYSLRDLYFRNTAGRPVPRASQAKKRRLARRMHCGHIKNLRLRA